MPPRFWISIEAPVVRRQQVWKRHSEIHQLNSTDRDLQSEIYDGCFSPAKPVY